ncbi:MAG: hypothetical protein AAB649_04810, partial [Patescibacteria group bacterium]
KQAGHPFYGRTKRGLIKALVDALEDDPKFKAMVAALINIEAGLLTHDQVVAMNIQKEVPASVTFEYHNNIVGWIFLAVGKTIKAFGRLTKALEDKKARKTTLGAVQEAAEIEAETARNVEYEKTRQELVKVYTAKVSNPNYGTTAISQEAIIGIAALVVIITVTALIVL